MRAAKLLLALPLIFSVAGCVGAAVGSAATSTGLLPSEVRPARITLRTTALEPSALEPHDVQPGTPVFIQQLRPREAAFLTEDASVKGSTLGDADIKLPAGTVMSSANDGSRERYFCAAGRRPGLIPLTMWSCFEDVDGDGRFDVAGQGPPNMGSVLPMVSSVTTMFPVSVGYRKETEEPKAQWEMAVFYEKPVGKDRIRLGLKARPAGEEKWKDVIPGNVGSSPIAIVDLATPPSAAALFDAQIEVIAIASNGTIKARVIEGFPAEITPSLKEVKKY